MRLCFNCWNITAGEAVFCNKCGFSYDRKLCPRQHVNPRAAKVCSSCGSKDLSTPQPNAPLLLRPLVVLWGIGPGYLILLSLLVYMGFYVRRLVQNPDDLLTLMCIGFALGVLLLLWISGHQVFSKSRDRGRHR